MANAKVAGAVKAPEKVTVKKADEQNGSKGKLVGTDTNGLGTFDIYRYELPDGTIKDEYIKK